MNGFSVSELVFQGAPKVSFSLSSGTPGTPFGKLGTYPIRKPGTTFRKPGTNLGIPATTEFLGWNLKFLKMASLIIFPSYDIRRKKNRKKITVPLIIIDNRLVIIDFGVRMCG